MTEFLAAVVAYVVMGGVSAVLNALDKWRASRGTSRISERTLHMVDLLGGIVGGELARRMVRHKTRKTSFRRVSWLIMALHVLGWGAALAIHFRWNPS